MRPLSMCHDLGQNRGDGPHRRAMGRPRTASAAAADTQRSPGSSLAAEPRGAERHLVGASNRRELEGPASPISAVLHVPSTILCLGSGWDDASDRTRIGPRPPRARRPGPRGGVRRRNFREREKGGAFVGKTKRGKGTKIMAMVDRTGLPIAIDIASASPHESKLLEDLLLQNFLQRRGDQPRYLIGDKAYDCDALDTRLAAQGIVLIAPNRSNRSRTQDGRHLRRYKRRWKVERFFAWLFAFRRLVVRYEHHARNFLGFLHLACALILLRHL
jgi:transposase